MRFKTANILSLILFFILLQFNSTAETVNRALVCMDNNEPLRIFVPVTSREEETEDKKKNEYLEKVHFYEREKMGRGYYITYDDFKNRGLLNIYDIFRNIPGVVVGERNISFARYGTFSVGDAFVQPLIYVDGILMINEKDNIGWLGPENVLAIELYKDNAAPVEYGRGKLGGVILIWTKH